MNNLLNFSKIHLQESEPTEAFIKDPILKTINFSKEQFWLYEIVNTFEFQRLAKIKQLSLTINNFPSCTHTRLTHSLGVYELCNRFTQHFIASGDLDKNKDQIAINIALATSLLHDIGHGPLSHALERALPHFHHEKMAVLLLNSPETKINLLLRKKAKEDNLDEFFYIQEIEKVFNKTSEHKWIIDLISSDIDIDRLDFLIRDSYYSGVQYGSTVDVSLLIKWSLLRKDANGDLRFFFQLKAKYMIGNFLLTRYHMYEELYRNRASLVYEDLLCKTFSYIKENQEYFKNLEPFKKISFLFSELDNWNIMSFLSLTDELFLSLFNELTNMDFKMLKFFRALFLGFSNKEDISTYLSKNPLEKDTSLGGEKITISFWDTKQESIVESTINISDFYN
ncbi:deoxyguanosinetriphosphate triphosphohydrolase [Candidatus Mycoplasma haematobovis]|uniref:Deoxyguanosinetriphosphate triphosphohydrolase n=1 Tax=Candidatus Mycoplasma haematobovis TaxID=432608 RepID=A0A1A9QC78_9MOLU|nr:HD domain-containing protein [Candidatus Mycoplasma haematobovis]OAL10182.1 deoxyguanosinetriphosphate triphosphohydrolase [Candidatus Mycoplasma haematobovis]